MKLIHEHAKEWYVDTDKIVVQGSSAGGHLAACLAMFWHTKWLAEMAGVTNDILKPAAMLLNYPVITSGEYAHRGSFKQLLGGNETEELLELLSLEKTGHRAHTAGIYLAYLYRPVGSGAELAAFDRCNEKNMRSRLSSICIR